MKSSVGDITITVGVYWVVVAALLYLDTNRYVSDPNLLMLCFVPPFAVLVRIHRLGWRRAALGTIIGFLPITLLGLFNLAAGAGRTADAVFLIPLVVAVIHSVEVLGIAFIYTSCSKLIAKIGQ